MTQGEKEYLFTSLMLDLKVEMMSYEEFQEAVNADYRFNVIESIEDKKQFFAEFRSQRREKRIKWDMSTHQQYFFELPKARGGKDRSRFATLRT